MQPLEIEVFETRIAPQEEGAHDARPAPDRPDAALGLDALRGRIVELSSVGLQGLGGVAARYLWEAQVAGHWPVWVSCGAVPLAEDLQAAGVDLDALVVVRAGSLAGALRAAERVMRSSVCGLVVVDVAAHAQLPASSVGRLLKIAQRSESACVFLGARERTRASLSPLVSLRMELRYEEDARLSHTPTLRNDADARLRHPPTMRNDADARRTPAPAHHPDADPRLVVDPRLPIALEIVRDKREGRRGSSRLRAKVCPGMR